MSITFWFDPTCPFTWRTSRWIRGVAARHGEDLRWRLLSLAILNEGKEIPELYRRYHAWSRRALRVLAAAEERHGQPAVDSLYSALGRRVHEDGEDHGDEVIRAAIAEAGLPAELGEAVDDSGYDAAIQTSHDESQARVGSESGSPVIALDNGPGFFGPVVVPVPTGEDADRLFEALRLLSAVPQFSELKRARNPL
jgi:2-hydroxychromene-2-carboxylate isomerase